MTSAGPPDVEFASVPEPLRHPAPIQPPASPRRGRALFFVAGLAALVLTYAARRMSERWDDSVTETGWEEFERGADFAALGLLGLAIAAVVVLRTRRGPRWRWASFAVGVLALPAVLLLTVWVGSAVDGWLHRRPFDPVAWRAVPTNRSDDRLWMADDLLARHPLVGRPVAEADELLGEQDGHIKTSPLHGLDHGRVDRLWCLYSDRHRVPLLRSRDREWLILVTDDAGRIVEARVDR